MKKPFIIGITGGSGSGKTTFINEIKKEFSKKEICIISQDDYYRPIHKQPIDSQGIEDFDQPKSIDKEAFVRDVKKLMVGKKIKRPEYTFNNKNVNPKILTFKPAPIIIVEGIFVFHFKKMQSLFDLKIFLEAKENLKVIHFRVRK